MKQNIYRGTVHAPTVRYYILVYPGIASNVSQGVDVLVHSPEILKTIEEYSSSKRAITIYNQSSPRLFIGNCMLGFHRFQLFEYYEDIEGGNAKTIDVFPDLVYNNATVEDQAAVIHSSKDIHITLQFDAGD